MAEPKRVEIGLGVGQVITVRISEQALGDLRKGIERGSGWHEMETEDGTVAVNLATVVFVKVAGAPHTIGFSGT